MILGLCRQDLGPGHSCPIHTVGLQLFTRATQFLQHQIRNGDRPRNLIFQEREGLFISRYNKTTNMKGRDNCVPAFLTPLLTEIMLVLLGAASERRRQYSWISGMGRNPAGYIEHEFFSTLWRWLC